MKHLYYPFGLARAFPVNLAAVLEDYNTGDIRDNPTLASGDVKISLDFGTFANLATLPDVEPNSTRQVRIQLAEAELDFVIATILFVDQTLEKEWEDLALHLFTRPNPVIKVATDGGNTTSTFKVTRFGAGTEATDMFKDAFLTGLDGALKGITRLCTAYNSTTDFVTVSGTYPTTPADGTYFEVVCR